MQIRLPTTPIILIGLLLVCGCSGQSGELPNQNLIRVAAPVSASNVLKEIQTAFQSRHPDLTIELTLGSSNAIAIGTTHGRPTDVFISANRRWADSVVESETVYDRFDLWHNSLVLIVPEENRAEIRGLSDLLSDRIRFVALAGAMVPAGIYGRQALKQHKILEPLESSRKIVRGSSVRSVLNFVQRNEADAGIVYASDVVAANPDPDNPAVRALITFDLQDHDPIVYPLLQLSERPGTADFIAFLKSAEAREIFARWGLANPVAHPIEHSG